MADAESIGTLIEAGVVELMDAETSPAAESGRHIVKPPG